jgi:hypothetical protein
MFGFDSNFLYYLVSIPIALITVGLALLVAYVAAVAMGGGASSGIIGLAFAAGIFVIISQWTEPLYDLANSAFRPKRAQAEQCAKNGIDLHSDTFGKDGCYPELIVKKNEIVKKFTEVKNECLKVWGTNKCNTQYENGIDAAYSVLKFGLYNYSTADVLSNPSVEAYLQVPVKHKLVNFRNDNQVCDATTSGVFEIAEANILKLFDVCMKSATGRVFLEDECVKRTESHLSRISCTYARSIGFVIERTEL